MRIELVPAPLVDRVWPDIAGTVDAAARKTGGDVTAGYLWQECRSGHAFLFIAHDGESIVGASVWRFETWQSGAKLRCLAGAGNGLENWIDPMREQVVTLAKAGGAASIVYEGREGWRRIRPKAKAIRTLYEEEL